MAETNVENYWNYKDWNIQIIDNSILKTSTNGKSIPGNEFGIIKKKGQCSNDDPATIIHT